VTPASFDVGALIPWYLNGTLSDEERAQVEAFLRESPDAEPQLQMWRAVQLQVRSQSLADSGTELGWRRLRRELKDQRVAPARAWRVAAAAGVLLLLGLQTAILLRQGGERYAPLSGTSTLPAESWRVQVRFEGSATMDEINALLLRLDAHVIGGPSALGIYELAVPRATAHGDVDEMRARLGSEPLVMQAVVMP